MSLFTTSSHITLSLPSSNRLSSFRSQLPSQLPLCITLPTLCCSEIHRFCSSETIVFNGRQSIVVALAVSREAPSSPPASDVAVTELPELIQTTQLTVNVVLDSVKWDEKGLAVAIAQNVDTGAILMQGFVNRDALSATISSRKATFFSRSRSSLWIKGETSKNYINIHDIFLDCDHDSIIYLGKPEGPTCHTGAETCYYSSIFDLLKQPQATVPSRSALTTLYSLESIVAQRKGELSTLPNLKPSWTKRLMLDHKLLCSKIREEANELCETLEMNEDKPRTVSEMSDLVYHAMVLLGVKDVKMEEVLEVLRRRFSQSGIDEKSSRGTSPS